MKMCDFEVHRHVSVMILVFYCNVINVLVVEQVIYEYFQNSRAETTKELRVSQK